MPSCVKPTSRIVETAQCVIPTHDATRQYRLPRGVTGHRSPRAGSKQPRLRRSATPSLSRRHPTSSSLHLSSSPHHSPHSFLPCSNSSQLASRHCSNSSDPHNTVFTRFQEYFIATGILPPITRNHLPPPFRSEPSLRASVPHCLKNRHRSVDRPLIKRRCSVLAVLAAHQAPTLRTPFPPPTPTDGPPRHPYPQRPSGHLALSERLFFEHPHHGR